MDIYEKHSAAFKDVSAYVVTLKGERVATVAFKRGNAITCYLHLVGIPMTFGRANGGGYDRHSAAAYDAILKAKTYDGSDPKMQGLIDDFKISLKEGAGGSHWDRALTDAGYKVLQAV